jgi:hypothetical protein
VKVYSVSWNSAVSPTVSTGMPKFFAAVTASPYFDWLSEYDTQDLNGLDGTAGSGQAIGRGSLGGTFTLTPSVTGAAVTDAQIQQELTAQIASGALPAPDDDSLYAIVFPKGMTETNAAGATSCTESGFCGYHGTFQIGAQDVFYAVLPSTEPGTGCDVGCGTDPNFFNNATLTASHELLGAVTDPELGLVTNGPGRPMGWASPGEIGDLCNDLPGKLVGADGVTYVVQLQYDNASGTCIVSKPPSSEDFSVSAPPSLVITVDPTSGIGTAALNVSTSVLTGGAAPVHLFATGLPFGVVPNFNRDPIKVGETATLTLSADSEAPAGAFSFTLTAASAAATHHLTISGQIINTGG